MINGRNNFTYAANIFTLLCSYILFLTFSDGTLYFRILTGMCIALGCAASVFYFTEIDEVVLTRLAKERRREHESSFMICGPNEEIETDEPGRTPADWLKQINFYLTGLVYMFSRMAFNTSSSLMPFYMITCLGFKQDNPDANVEQASPMVALAPLLTYTASLVFSLKA